MKNTKKKVFVVALAICLVAIISMGSLAWFTASDSVDNTFKIADSNDDANDVFSIDLYEKKDTAIQELITVLFMVITTKLFPVQISARKHTLRIPVNTISMFVLR